MHERADVGDLVRINRGTWPSDEASITTALVVAVDDDAWAKCRWSPVGATWLPPEKIVVISKAYKKK